MVKRDRKAKAPVDPSGQFLTAPMPRNPELEAGIRDHGHAVYADWLQTQGSPAGEWIALAAALEKKADARKKKRLDALSAELALPSDKFATWGTKHGFWQWLRLHMHVEENIDAVALCSRILATPLCAALDELRIGILRWDYNSEDVPAVLGEAAKHPWAKQLPRLFLGDAGDDIDMAHHVIGDVGKRITKAFPALQWLKLHSGEQGWRNQGETFGIGGLALPKLETLVIETCAMTKKRLKSLFAAKLPALTTLELWFGSADYDSDVIARDLAPLLEGKLFPKLVHLGLRNQAFTGELLEYLARSKLASRLVTLDLSMSTIDDETAPQLATIAKHFTSLETLDVHDNFITAKTGKALKQAFDCEVVVGKQDKLKWLGDDPNWRYVSVHE